MRIAVFLIFLCLPGLAAAQGFQNHRLQTEVAGWRVICAENDDMGAITRERCAAQAPADLIVGTERGEVFFALPEATVAEQVEIAERVIALSECTDDRCMTGQTEADLLEGRVALRLHRPGFSHIIALLGLRDALAEAERLNNR